MYADKTGAHQCSACEGGKYQNDMQQLSCKNCPAGKYQSAGAGTYTKCKTCGVRLTPSSCVTEAAPPTQQVLVLDQSDARAKATTLETREDAVARVDVLKVQLTTCTTTFNEEKAFATATQVAKQAAETNAATAAVTAATAAATAAAALSTCQAAATSAQSTGTSRAGAVALDIDGNNRVDASDAIQLFVATTMQGFGAQSLLERFQAGTDATTPPATIVATVAAALGDYPL
jgi:hypothetical protein